MHSIKETHDRGNMVPVSCDFLCFCLPSAIVFDDNVPRSPDFNCVHGTYQACIKFNYKSSLWNVANMC